MPPFNYGCWATCENRKEPNQHRVVLSRLKTTFSAARKKNKKTSWDELTQSYCEQQQNSWSVYVGSDVLFGVFTAINGETLRVGTPSSCVFSLHVGLPPVFFFSPTLRGSLRPIGGTAASRLNCTDCSIAHICCCCWETTQVKMTQTDTEVHAKLRQGRRTFVRMLGEFVLEPRRQADREEILDRFQLWHAEAGSYSQSSTTRKLIFACDLCLWQEVSQKYTHICFRQYTYA